MSINSSVFVRPGATFNVSDDPDYPYLAITPDDAGLDLAIVHFAGRDHGAALRQVDAMIAALGGARVTLLAAIENAAPFAAIGPDDPDDEPTDEPAAPDRYWSCRAAIESERGEWRCQLALDHPERHDYLYVPHSPTIEPARPAPVPVYPSIDADYRP